MSKSENIKKVFFTLKLHAQSLRTGKGTLINLICEAEKEFEQLEQDATKWNNPQTQSDLELAAAVRKAFEDKEYCKFVGEFHIIEAKSASGLIDWHREQKRGAK